MFYEVEQHISLLETFIGCENKELFIESLNNPTEKTFLKILTANIDDIASYKKELNKLQVSQKFRQAILRYKLKQFIQGCATAPNKKLLQELKTMFCPSIHFNYQKPANIRREEIIQDENALSRINILNKDIRQYINEKVLEDNFFLTKLESLGMSVLTEQTLIKLELKGKQRFFKQNKFIMELNPHTLDNFFRKYLAEYQKEHKIKSEISQLQFPFQKLTKQQINILGQRNEDLFHNISFCKEWLAQNYRHFLDQYTQANYSSLQKERYFLQNLLKIQKDVMNHNSSYGMKVFQYTILTEILATQIQLSLPKQTRFNEFINSQLSNFCDFNFFTEKFKGKLNKKSNTNDRQLKEFVRIFKTENVGLRGFLKGTNLLIEDYLIQLFKITEQKQIKKLIERLGQTIQAQYLKKLQVKVKLMRGEECQQATDFWTHNELVLFKQKKQIKINTRNQHIYKAQDDVTISLTLKNVKQLQIKVYELNLLKQHLTNKLAEKRTYDDINLSYFSPSSTDLFINPSSNPFEYNQVKIPIKNIPNKIGVFVIDFQGEGITSRAVIRKGSILCLEKYSLEGQSFGFYDEDGKQLTQKEGLSIWIQRHKISLCESNFFNSASIDAQKRGEKTQIIASLGCFAQKFIKNTKYQYTISINAISTAESFINQKKSKIILKANLKLNNNITTLSNLKNIKATVNQLTGKVITSSNTYQFAEWEDNKEQLVEFFPQTDVNTITIQVKGQIPDKKKILIESNKIEVFLTSDHQNEETSIAQPYLKKLPKDTYQIILKGKNGQGIQNKEVNLQFDIKGTTHKEVFKFITDSHGIIQLGKLTAVKSITYSLNNIYRNWTIDQILNNYTYDKVMYAFPGEQFILPVSPLWTSKDVFLLHCLSQKGEKSDQTQNVTLKDGNLAFIISQKKPSTYKLRLIPINLQIHIEVITSGVKWKSKHEGKQIVVDAKEGKILQIERGSRLKTIFLEKVRFDDSNEHHTLCKIILGNVDKLTKQELAKLRVHVLATNYFGPNLEFGFNNQAHFLKQDLNEQFRQLHNSTYLSNKTLSEEAAYIFNRQKQKGRIGSNLEKPGLFLRRLMIRDTVNVVGELEKEGKFEKKKMELQKMRRGSGTNYKSNQRKEKCITKHNNFLLLSGFVKHNLGFQASVEIPKGYSHIQVYLITPQNGTKATFSIGGSQTPTKDIRYKGLIQNTEGQSWNISRQVYNLKQSDQNEFSKKCQYKTVTLTEVFQYAQKIIFIGNQKLYSWKDNLIHWHSYSEQQKIKLFNKYYCHQLSVFIKFKDEPFFEKIVKTFINNKFKKNFIHLCLLEDPLILQHLNLKKLLLLNNFECALFIYALIKLDKKEMAQKVVERMELRDSKSLPFKVKSTNFDNIINSFAGKSEIKDQNQPIKMAEGAMKPQLRMFRQTSECEFKGRSRSRSQSAHSDSQSEGDDDLALSECQIPQNIQKKKQVDSTRQYTQLTYYYESDQKYPFNQSKPTNSPFWSELAKHFLQGGKGNFISPSFTQFTNGLQVMLAAAFIPGKEANHLTLEDGGQNYKLTANIGLSLFVKEQKEYPFQQKEGVYIYQTLTTLSKLEANKEIIATEIRAGEQYYLSTIFSNSTSDFLDLQILCPIPQGSIPLKSKEVTILQNNLGPFKTDVYKQSIYFPSPGLFKLPTANILDMKSGVVISHSPVNLPIAVIKPNQGKRLESFQDIIQYGGKNEIIEFLKAKNIFSQQVFKPNLILWMLSDASFFNTVISILRERFYFQQQIWKFSLLHGNPKALCQYLDLKDMTLIRPFEDPNAARLISIGEQAFQYYPYFQKRTHRYANQNRSSIKNVDLKETYISFLICIAISSYKNPKSKLAHAYYLILQDRLSEAQKLLDEVPQKDQKVCELQVDYIRCFLDMGLNGQHCQIARTIAPKYQDYPVVQWKNLFSQITQTLKAPPVNQSQSKQNLETKVSQYENGDIFIKRSIKKQIKVQIFPTNMQLFFTEHSFELKKCISNFSISKPIKEILIGTDNTNSEIVIAKEEFKQIKNPYIEVSEHGDDSHKKIKSILWSDPRIIAKLHQQQGIVQVFVEGKRSLGSYIKVFIIRKGLKRPTAEGKFYVDGYTDIAGKFRYALTDLNTIEEFALLIITPIGATVKYVSPPNIKTENEGKDSICSHSHSSSSSSSSSSPSLRQGSKSPNKVKKIDKPRLLRQLS